MRILGTVFGILTLLLASFYTIAFTQFGNDFLKPTIEKKIQESSSANIKLDSFKLRLGTIETTLSLDDSAKVSVMGVYSLLTQTFNLDYTATLLQLKQSGLNLDEKIDFKGKILGTPKNFEANGSGLLFGSNARFLAHIKEYKPLDMELDAKGLHIDKILHFLGKPAYAKGILNAIVSMKEKNGKALLTYDANANSTLFKQDFNITLPQDFDLQGKSDAIIEDGMVHIVSNIKTPIAKLDAKNSIYDIDSNIFMSDFDIDIPSLLKLEPIVGQQLHGSVKIDGETKIIQGKIDHLDLNLKGFGGEVVAKIANNKADADIKNLKLSQLLKVVGQDAYADGKLNGNIKLTDLAKLEADAKLAITDGTLNSTLIKELASIELPKNSTFTLNADANIKDDNVNFKSNIDSSFAKISKFDGSYNLGAALLKADYLLNVDNLKKISFLTGAELNGKADIIGTLNQNKQDFSTEAIAKIFKEDIKLAFADNILNVKLDNFAITELTDLLGYDRFYEGAGALNADYNTKTKVGKYHIAINDGKLLANQFTNLVATFGGLDLTSEVYNNSYLKGNIIQNIIDYTLFMEAKRSKLQIDKGTLDSTNQALDAPFMLAVEKTDINGHIGGTTKQPQVSINSSKYLQEKAIKKLDKLFGGKQEPQDSNQTVETTTQSEKEQKRQKKAETFLKLFGQ